MVSPHHNFHGQLTVPQLLMNDAYLPGMSSILYLAQIRTDNILGAMVLGHSLKDRGAKAPLVAFIVADKLSSETIKELRVCHHFLYRWTATNLSRPCTTMSYPSTKSPIRNQQTSISWVDQN